LSGEFAILWRLTYDLRLKALSNGQIT
jgi:hypothetical protein